MFHDIDLNEMFAKIEGDEVVHHFEINVSMNNVHLFATHERSITTRKKLEDVLAQITKRFPKKEGWHISVVALFEYGRILYGAPK